MKKSAKLYICPTPIGNLEDITLRVLKILKKVDYIYAEDTRRTIKLLNHFEINSNLKSYHKHNKETKGKKIIKRLRNNESIALVSDAGMPGISDPGHDLIKLCIKEKLEFEVLPGPTAFVLALIQSGLNTKKFSFEGFLERKKKSREKQLKNLEKDDKTLIFYESPYRIKKSLKSILKILGNREIAICRELTKKFEEVLRVNVEQAIKHFNQNKPKGEFVIVVKGDYTEEIIEYNMSIKEHILIEMDKGLSKKQAIKEVAKLRDLKKNVVYKESFEIDHK